MFGKWWLSYFVVALFFIVDINLVVESFNSPLSPQLNQDRSLSLNETSTRHWRDGNTEKTPLWRKTGRHREVNDLLRGKLGLRAKRAEIPFYRKLEGHEGPASGKEQDLCHTNLSR